MNFQWAGIAIAVTTLATIAVGHVLVRDLHPKFGTQLCLPFMILGVIVMTISVFIDNNLLSSILGIVGITTLWDGIEYYRQEKRVQRSNL